MADGEILAAVNALHGRIDAVADRLHKRIDEALKEVGKNPERPCPDLKGHLKDHKDIQKTWIGELIRGFICTVVILGTAFIIYKVGWR